EWPPSPEWSSPAAVTPPGPVPPGAVPPGPVTPPGPVPPGPVPPGPVPPGAVPPGAPPRRRRRGMLWTIVAVSVLAGLCVAGVVVGSVAGFRAYHRSHHQAAAGMGQPARDGEFMFTADKVTCGLSQVGPPDDYLTPTGEFCVVQLDIRNVGTGP